MKILITILLGLYTTIGNSQDLYFPPVQGSNWETTAIADLGWCEEEVPALLNFLEDSETVAFIVLKDGKIVIEEYFDGHAQDSVWYWASAGKSLKAFEIGMLQEQGLLDIEAPTSDYLGLGWTSCPGTGEAQIKVKHQLAMTTGLDFSTGNLDCTTPDCLTCVNEPGTEWYYHNGPYTLLTGVMDNITGTSHTLHTFLTLGTTAGIRGGWVQLGTVETFFSTPRVMARFGLLMNARGRWGNQTILGDESYFHQMTSSSQSINESYGYLWWLNSGPTFRAPNTTLTFQGKFIENAPEHIYMGLGKNSQILMVDSVENIVIVRMGNGPDESPVPTVFLNNLWDNVAKVICTTTATEAVIHSEVKLSPNPVQDILSVSSSLDVKQIAVYSIQGELLLQQSDSKSLDMSNLTAGIYLVAISTAAGQQFEKVVKF